MDTDIQIRRFQNGDSEHIQELHETAMSQTPEWIPNMPDEDLQDIQGHYFNKQGEFLVGIANDSIVAMGGYSTPDDWKHSYLALLKSYWLDTFPTETPVR